MNFIATKVGGSLFTGNRFVEGMYGRRIWRTLVEKRTDKGMDQKEKRKRDIEIGGRIVGGGHCRLQGNVVHEL